LDAGAVPPEAGDANTVDSGIAGLVLVRTGTGGQWRLVHQPTGLLVSRSAVSHDPQVLRRLAYELGPLADWTRRELPLPGPALRQAVEAAATRCGLALGAVNSTSTPAVPGDHRPEPGRHAAAAHEALQRDLELVSRVLRRVHTSVPPGVLASAIADLGATERARLREVLTAGTPEARSDAVVHPMASPSPPRPGTRGAGTGRRSSPGSATG
jgi:hypothetical protein